MSKCTPIDKAFIKDCREVASGILSAWGNGVNCYYDGSPYCTKRDYVLRSTHSWGTAYCDWSGCRENLFKALRDVGATNIIGKVKWNYIDIAFDIKKSRLKADGIAI